jgi:hypothetical protein
MLEDRALLLQSWLPLLLLLHNHLANDLLAAAVGLDEQTLLLRVRLLMNENNVAALLALLIKEDCLRLLYNDDLLATGGGHAGRGGLQVQLACGGLVDLLAAAPRVPHQ